MEWHEGANDYRASDRSVVVLRVGRLPDCSDCYSNWTWDLPFLSCRERDGRAPNCQANWSAGRGQSGVSADGAIDFGKYGRPVVVGKTITQIETLVGDLIMAREKKGSRTLGNPGDLNQSTEESNE
jgi:hypothetical protein